MATPAFFLFTTALSKRIASKNEEKREKRRETRYQGRRYRARFTEHSIIASVGCCTGKVSRYRFVLGILWVGIGLAETSRAETICESAFLCDDGIILLIFFVDFSLLEEVAT